MTVYLAYINTILFNNNNNKKIGFYTFKYIITCKIFRMYFFFQGGGDLEIYKIKYT